MIIRTAQKEDISQILQFDRHIAKAELSNIILLNRALIIETEQKSIGFLRWNLFWDNTPFLNLLWILEEYRCQGFGKALLTYWEQEMKQSGYSRLLTSTLSNETAQHFYRKSGYRDVGSLLLPDEPLEILFLKELK